MALRPQTVVYCVLPLAALVAVELPAAGPGGSSADGPVWIDAIAGAAAVSASAFNGHPRCTLIRKRVDFDLPAATRVIIQLSQSRRPAIGLAVTKAAPQKT
jgi:hypothetical protein